MNKTIIININGTVFHIEEQAYELLKEYMTDVKRHFFNSADSLEITTDIENRIAEMFTEILAREARQAIIDQDVAAVIEQMGSVKDFESAEENETSGFSAEPAFGASTGSRRLFRDPDDHLVAGVCAGIANYFDIQALWVRLFFAVSFVFAGTGFLVYVILWIIVPKAATRADRMAMKGEPLDLQGFKRNFEAELSSVSGHLKNLKQEARPLAYQTRDFISDFFHHFFTFMGGTGRIIVKVLALMLIISCIGGIIAVIVGLIMTWGFSHERHFFLGINFWGYQYLTQVYVAVSLIIILPLLGLIALIARTAFNTTSINRSAAYTLLIIWVSALLMLGYHGSRLASEFREQASFTQTLNLKATPNQVYYLKLNSTRFLTAEDSTRLDIKNKFNNMVITDSYNDDDMEPRSVRIDIEKSDVPYPVLVEEFTARGRDYESALINARNTRYIFTQQDSVLKFDYKLRRLNDEYWHNEEVKLVLRIPLNATVILNDRMNNYISNYMNIWECAPGDNHSKTDEAPFVMTEEGMKCKFEKVVKTDDKEHKTDTIITTEAEPVVTDTVYIDSVEAPKPAPVRKKTVIIRRHLKK